MCDNEYSDGYQQEHPELIPTSKSDAETRLAASLKAGLRNCDTQTFLRGWWAFSWLNPGFHPDDYRQWSDLSNAQEFAEEAFRRSEAGEIDDGLLYAAEAVHNAVWLERIARHNQPGTNP